MKALRRQLLLWATLLDGWRGEHGDEQDRLRIQRSMDERARGGAQIE